MFVSAGFLGFLFALMEVYAKDHKAVAEEGFFQGYNSVVWILVTVQVLPVEPRLSGPQLSGPSIIRLSSQISKLRNTAHAQYKGLLVSRETIKISPTVGVHIFLLM